MPEDIWGTRRAFLGKAVVGSIAFSLPILNNGGSAHADAYLDCLASAYNDYFLDRLAAGRIANAAARAVALAAARAAYAARLTACASLRLASAVSATAVAVADWIQENPLQAIGTIVIIAGVAFIVIASKGGVLILVPAAAL